MEAKFQIGDYVINFEQIRPEIRGKILSSFIHEWQNYRYYNLKGVEEPQHELKLSLIISAKELEEERQLKNENTL